MTTTTPGSYDTPQTTSTTSPRVWRFTETKAGAKSTEFMFMVLFIVAVLIATYIDGDAR